jgi:RHS repeat-associated protein
MNREQDRHRSSLRTSVLRAGALLVLACGLLAGPAWAQHFEPMEFYHYDALGSVRLVVAFPHDATTYTISRRDYLPFGEEIQPGTFGRARNLGYGNGDTTPQRFTAKERDPESNLDYFGARYYSGAQGRFTSADRTDNDLDEADPQKWNRYAYVQNRPLNHVDPNGESATVIGAVGGFLGVGAVSLGSQLLKGKGVDWGRVGTDALAGGAGGALAGSVIDTCGGSALVIVGAGMVGGTTTGFVGRGLQGQETTPEQGAQDAAVGGATALAGVAVAKGAGALTGAARSGPSVQQNKAVGDALRDEVADALEGAGREVKTEVTKQTPFGPRRVDIEVSHNGKVLGGVETKANTSRYLSSQRAKDWYLRHVKKYPVNVVREDRTAGQ